MAAYNVDLSPQPPSVDALQGCFRIIFGELFDSGPGARLALASHRRHLLEFRHGRIEPVPGMTVHRVRHHLRLVSAWIVEARGLNGEETRHGREGQIDRRPAGGAEAARLYVPAIADQVPMRRFAL